ncbi:hypothetical protein GCM10017562_24040 [Streptomyces roseofulvus]
MPVAAVLSTAAAAVSAAAARRTLIMVASRAGTGHRHPAGPASGAVFLDGAGAHVPGQGVPARRSEEWLTVAGQRRSRTGFPLLRA